MDDERGLEIREEARTLLASFTDAELLVLKTHISIHRRLTRVVAERRGVETSSLRHLTFLAAAKQAHGSTLDKRLFSSLQLLNDARNIVAHEEFTGEIFIKVGEIGRITLGPASPDANRFGGVPRSILDSVRSAPVSVNH